MRKHQTTPCDSREVHGRICILKPLTCKTILLFLLPQTHTFPPPPEFYILLRLTLKIINRCRGPSLIYRKISALVYSSMLLYRPVTGVGAICVSVSRLSISPSVWHSSSLTTIRSIVKGIRRVERPLEAAIEVSFHHNLVHCL